MHALDTPVSSCGIGQSVDVERRRRDMVAHLEFGSVGVHGPALHFQSALDLAEAGLAR